MKTDLDALMKAQDLDAILVTGPGQHNAPMVYLTGGGHFSGDCIKIVGQAPVLFHWPMEREEAARSGLPTRSYADYPYKQYLQQSGGDHAAAAALRWQHMLAGLGITAGRIGLYGLSDLGRGYAIITHLLRLLPGLEIANFTSGDPLGLARLTKDAAEVDRIRRVGQGTLKVVDNTADFLTSHPAKDGWLLKSGGDPLTVGDVQARIRLGLAELGLEAPEGFIFSVGRDAGVPHSSGNPADLIRTGQTMVFDIYPCEGGGGYFYDFTRTWCIGYVPDAVQAVYEQVRQVYTTICSALTIGQDFAHYQRRACELFRSMGHLTPEDSTRGEEGYVHGLGHGVGLDIHERPISGSKAHSQEIIAPGSVITIEPGLYYPNRGFGVRLEDTLWANPDGGFEVLAEYPLDLVLK